MSRVVSRTSPVSALAFSALAVTLVSAAIALIDDVVPVLSLGVLYLFAVLAVAILFGSLYATAVAVVSMLAFNFLFLPPVHTFTLADSGNWLALAVYVVSAIVVGTLAAHARQRASESEQREAESALLADIATDLLGGTPLEDELDGLAARVGQILELHGARIELGEPSAPRRVETPYLLVAGEVVVGTLYAQEGESSPASLRRRLLPALAALLAVAEQRERLAREAVEAETLRRSDAIKTTVIRSVSHDFRTPLATIEAALDGLERDEIALTDRDRASLLDSIRVEHRRLKRLVEDLLDLSRLQAGALEPAVELWPIEELVGQALDELGSPGAVTVAAVDETLPDVRVDAAQIQRVLVNLLDNALRFSPPDEGVTVTLDATEQGLRVRVSDHGPGVPERERERIFAPFHRLADGGPGGAGLGLAIARGFAEANGGRLWLEPPAGDGAAFVLVLPGVERPAGLAA
jgi:two-component system sensor histidine kinase KdpD